IALISSASVFDAPARAAFLPSIVSRDFFPRAVTISSTNQALAFVTGPALCGLVIASAGIGATYAVLAFVAAFGLLFIHPRPVAGARSTISLHSVREGLRFVRHRQVLLGCMTLD